MQSINNYSPQSLGLDPHDPKFQGRFWNPVKGTYKSCAKDPWMESQNRVSKSFIGWLQAERKRRYTTEPSLADLQSEIRNDFQRAMDLWDEYQQNNHSLCKAKNIAQKNNFAVSNILSPYQFLNEEILDNWEDLQRKSAINLFENNPEKK